MIDVPGTRKRPVKADATRGDYSFKLVQPIKQPLTKPQSFSSFLRLVFDRPPPPRVRLPNGGQPERYGRRGEGCTRYHAWRGGGLERKMHRLRLCVTDFVFVDNPTTTLYLVTLSAKLPYSIVLSVGMQAYKRRVFRSNTC